MGKIYFAHPINVYDQPIEMAFEELIASSILGDNYSLIENPNQPHHQEGYKRYAVRQKESDAEHKGMGYFFDEVLPNCLGGCVVLPFLDGKFGLGVAGEAKWYMERHLPVWPIRFHPLPFESFSLEYQLQYFIKNPRNGSFYIQTMMPQEKDCFLNINPQRGSDLVLSQEETRLRTWKVYNREKRPYEEAHLVNMPVPEDFYPKG